MREFLHKYNTDNVHTRAVIVGLINLLNSKIQYENVLSDLVVETIGVPFFPNMGGDERFLQDFFLHWSDCQHPRMADGNYDVIPRGVVTLTGNTINTTAMTHRFVRGTYVREVNGELQRFNSFLNSLPLTMTFDLEVETDTMIDSFKIQQAILETFYKVQVFSVSFKGFRIPCQAGFSEDLGIEKTFEFTYQEENSIKFKFAIEIETYFPVVDQTKIRLDSNRMVEIVPQPSSVSDKRLILNRSLNQKSSGSGFRIQPTKEKLVITNFLEFTSPLHLDSFFSSGTLPIMWNSTGVINQVNLYYRVEGEEQWRPIVFHTKNTGFYEWVIPFFDEDATVIESDNISTKIVSSTGIKARIRSIIDVSGGVEKVVVFEGGIAYDSQDLIQVSPDAKPFTTPVPFSPPVIQAKVDNEGSVIGGTIVDTGSGFKKTNTTRITIKIEDSFSPSTYNVLEKRGSFFGDIDKNSLLDDKRIKNLNPTAQELVQDGLITNGMRIIGDGLAESTIVEEINVFNNTLILNNSVTDVMTGAKFSLEKVNAVIKIR